MTAMLGMYDMPALHAHNDRFWDQIRTHLGFGPASLERSRDFWEIWRDPNLIFAQTCGMPYRTQLRDVVQLIGTPDYSLPGCPEGYYRSVFVARADDPRSLAELVDGVFAFNEPLSQSGWSAPITHLSQLGLAPKHLQQTGAHANSAQAVAEGMSDFAALDALTWEILKVHTDMGVALRDVAETEPSPGLPYITSKSQDAPRIARAVQAAIDDLPDEDRSKLCIRGLINIPASAYFAIPTAPAPEAQ